jgi:predicted amidophosphoribosyltransferase
MSHLCRECGKPMPKNRKGWEQICPDCKEQQRLKEVEIDCVHEDWGCRD